MAITPTPALPENGCLGLEQDGVTVDRKLKCVKSEDEDGSKVYTCTTWRYFRVNCPKINFQCSSLSGAYVAAVTVCNQKLY
jgi:hypothetical protein